MKKKRQNIVLHEPIHHMQWKLMTLLWEMRYLEAVGPMLEGGSNLFPRISYVVVQSAMCRRFFAHP